MTTDTNSGGKGFFCDNRHMIAAVDNDGTIHRFGQRSERNCCEGAIREFDFARRCIRRTTGQHKFARI